VAPNGVLNPTVKPAQYFPFIDFNLNSQLSKFHLINGGPLNGPGLLNEKWESIALLPTFRKKNEFFLLSVKYPPRSGMELLTFSDNDFVTQNGFFNFGETTYKDPSGLDFTVQSLVFLVEL
jgi:hypothetical protein